MFFYTHWFSYKLAARHFDEQISYPICASVLLLIPTIILWIRAIRKKSNPFWAILVSILFAGAILCIFGGFNGRCVYCAWPPDRVYQWLHTLKYGHPLECTW
jgi:DMSO reductase anchor subunit